MIHPSILIVDDERLIRWSLGERLKRSGYRVITAGSGHEAMKLLSDEVELVLLDQNLPDVRGLTLLREIRQRNPQCPVILVTAEVTPQFAEEARRRGVFGVVDKPFDLDTIATLVETALIAGGRASSASV